MGDTILNNHTITDNRGIFGFRSATVFRDIKDGTSNTIMLGEKAKHNGTRDVRGLSANNQSGMDTRPVDCLLTASDGKYIVATQNDRTHGGLWASGLVQAGGFNTVLPPNSPSCIQDNWGDTWGLISAGSYHTGGVQVVLADGSVRFISENIDTGDISQPGPGVNGGESPYGLWGALGTKNSGEVIGDY